MHFSSAAGSSAIGLSLITTAFASSGLILKTLLGVKFLFAGGKGKI
jgi:hypothetical protein